MTFQRTIILLCLAGNFFMASAGYEDFRAISRLNYYTTEEYGQVLVIVPDEYLEQDIEIDLVYRYQHLIRGFPVPGGHNTGLVPFPLKEFEEEEGIVVCSFYLNKQWVHSEHITITKLPHSSNEVKIDHYSGGLVVGDLPFYPFGFYCYSPVHPTLPEEEVVKGFNMISPYQRIEKKTLAERRAYMERCAALGMKVHYNLLSVAGGGGVGSGRATYGSDEEKRKLLEEEILAFRDHPALLAWYICDEPVGQGVKPESLSGIYNLIKKLDPYHPVSMVFMTPSKANDYKDVMDIVMADPYPIPDRSINEVAQVTASLRKEFYPEKPVWIVPQAFGGNEWWKREPTAAEIRAMTYMALINGAAGIQYFIRQGMNAFPKSTTTWNECGAMALEVAELTPGLFFYVSRPEVTSGDKNIMTAAYSINNGITLLTVNTLNSPQPLTLKIKDLHYNGKAKVLFENRETDVTNGEIRDYIDGLGTRIYRIDTIAPAGESMVSSDNLVLDPSFEDVIMPGVPEACYAKTGTDHGATYFVDSRLAVDGTHSLRLTTPAEESGVKLIFFPVKIQNDLSYTLSVMAKASDQSLFREKKGFFYRIFHRQGKYDHPTFRMGIEYNKEGTFELSPEWSEYQVSGISVDADKTVRMRPVLKLLSKGTAWFDLLQVVPDITISAQPAGKGNGLLVEVTSLHKDAEIRYTFDGNEPDVNSLLYEGPFAVDHSLQLRVAAFENGKLMGFAEREIRVTE